MKVAEYIALINSDMLASLRQTTLLQQLDTVNICCLFYIDVPHPYLAHSANQPYFF